MVNGGLLYRCCRKARLCGDRLERTHRRVLVFAGITWLPLLVLSTIGGQASGGGIGISFLHDIETHVRFLIALPVLIVAERIVHRRIRPFVSQFLERRIIPAEARPEFNQIIASTMRLRNSSVIEAGLMVLVYTLGLWLWKNEIAQEGASWYALPAVGRMNLTTAGFWYAFVSVPFFQFILMRWYLRIFLWFVFLWRVSRLDLRLMPSHPDQTAGLGFLGGSAHVFGPVLFAQGALLAGLIAGQILYAGDHLLDFKMQIAGFLVFFMAIIFLPLTVFTPRLAKAKRKGADEFGKLACRYSREFEAKWFGTGVGRDEAILSNGDIQSLADLGSTFSTFQQMRIIPFGLKDVAALSVTTALPLLPLCLTVFSPEELIGHLIKFLL